MDDTPDVFQVKGNKKLDDRKSVKQYFEKRGYWTIAKNSFYTKGNIEAMLRGQELETQKCFDLYLTDHRELKLQFDNEPQDHLPVTTSGNNSQGALLRRLCDSVRYLSDLALLWNTNVDSWSILM